MASLTTLLVILKLMIILWGWLVLPYDLAYDSEAHDYSLGMVSLSTLLGILKLMVILWGWLVLRPCL